MPNKYASGVKLIKRKRKIKYLAIGLVVVALVLTLGEVLASLIRYGSISIFASGKVKAFSVYALSMGEYSTKDDADKASASVTLRGAGGYVWTKGDKYYVLASIYPTQADANSVAQGITEYNCQVIEIKFNSVHLNLDKLDNSGQKKVKESLTYLRALYGSLYDNVLKLDTKEITNIACSNNINYYKSQCKSTVVELMQLNANNEYSVIAKIINTYIAIIDSLDSCMNKLLQTGSVSYVAKYMLCEVTLLSHSLINAL